MPDINLNLFQEHVQNFMNIIKSSGDAKVDEQTFLEKITNDRSIFEMLDQNHDNNISEGEINTVLHADSDNDGIVTENEYRCIQMVKYNVKRDIDKWFSFDINRDGHISNVEDIVAYKRLFENTGLESSMTNEQLAEWYNLQEVTDEDKNLNMESWLNGSIEDAIQTARNQYGIELNASQIIILQQEQKKYLNTWLFKKGDNVTEDAPLYNSLDNNAYTRLVTTKQTVSCCSGDIVPPPAADNKNGCSFVFSDLESESSLNNAEEVKNRLAWAMFKTPPKNELSNNPNGTVWENMTDDQYAQYHEQYVQMRNMKASGFSELLKPENKPRRIAFEQNSSMTVKQIVDYIHIIERYIGEGNFDNDDWSVSAEQYRQIISEINGTAGDEDRLHGMTRADILDTRKNLLRFLETKGWLLEQFKL